jgi:hypothetical protein
MFKKFGYNEDKMEKITKNNPKNLTHFLAGMVFVQTLNNWPFFYHCGKSFKDMGRIIGQLIAYGS